VVQVGKSNLKKRELTRKGGISEKTTSHEKKGLGKEANVPGFVDHEVDPGGGMGWAR